MVISPINPMRYWHLEELQKTLNKIEGYEKVVIEFQYSPSYDSSKPSWDCQCGIRELNREGRWEWLYKYRFVMDDYLETNLKVEMWEAAADKLVLDVWRTSINSLRKEKQLANQMKSMDQLRKLNTQPLTKKDLNIMDEINKMSKKVSWSENKRWLLSVGILSAIFGLMYTLYKFDVLLPTIVSIGVFYVVIFLLTWVKDIVDDILGL